MGETLDNLDAVATSAEALNHPLGLHVSHNKVTVSTVGLADRLDEFVARCAGAQLAVSLHATTDEVRDAIVPANRRHKLAELLGALERLYPRHRAGGDANSGSGGASGSGSKRRVLIEYVMLDGVNDSLEDAERLVALLDPIEAKVNLITFNPFPGTKFGRTPIEQVLAFRSVLIRAGRVCTIRDSRGGDAAAACGQLGDVEGAAAARRSRLAGGGGSGGSGGGGGGGGW
jgi:23S rRNA (adenine2503-C2)-methyltransferase